MFKSNYKRNKFVNELKNRNEDLLKNKVHKRIIEMFDEQCLVIDNHSYVQKGPKFRLGNASIQK